MQKMKVADLFVRLVAGGLAQGPGLHGILNYVAATVLIALPFLLGLSGLLVVALTTTQESAAATEAVVAS